MGNMFWTYSVYLHPGAVTVSLAFKEDPFFQFNIRTLELTSQETRNVTTRRASSGHSRER